MITDYSEGANRNFKVCLCGTASVGKTAIINRYLTGLFFRDSRPTIAAGFVNIEIIDENHKINLNIWDTAGQETYQSMSPLYTHNSNAIIAVFDVSNIKTLQYVKKIYDGMYQNITPTPIFYICGNKIDIEKDERVYAELEWAANLGISIFYTSALTGAGIEEMFVKIGKELDAERSKKIIIRNSVDLVKEKGQEGRCC